MVAYGIFTVTLRLCARAAKLRVRRIFKRAAARSGHYFTASLT